MGKRNFGLDSLWLVICYCFVISVFWFCDLTLFGTKPNFFGILFLVLAPPTCIVWGRIYYKAFSIEEVTILTVESCFVIGFWLISLVLGFVVFCLPSTTNVVVLFTVLCVGTFSSLIVKTEFIRQVSIGARSLQLLTIVCLAVSLLSQTGIIQKVVIGKEIIFLPWSDYFIHSSMIQRICEGAMLGSSQEFAIIYGIPAPMYHYLSYIFSSILRGVSNLPSINVATAFWLPFGGLLSGLGAFVFGNSMWGKKEGILCALAITLLPDPYWLGCGLGYFSYHWLGQVGPAHLYGNAIAAVGLGLIGQGITKGNARIILAGFIPITSLIFFKVHVFVVVFPAASFWAILSFPRLGKMQRLLGILCLMVGLGLAALLAWSLNYISLGKPWAIEFFRDIFPHSGQGQPHLHTTIFWLTQRTSFILDDLAIGTVLTWLGALGPVLVLSFILTCYLWKKGLLNFRDEIPFLCLFLWTILILAMPANANRLGTVDEFHHRPFHVVYYFSAIWLTGRFCNLVKGSVNYFSKRSWFVRSRLELVLWVVSFCLLIIPLRLGSRVFNVGHWTSRLQHFKVDTGLWKAAEFIRDNGILGDVVLDSSEDNYFNVVCGISERRLFLSHPYLRRISEKSPYFGLIKKRQEVHNALKECVSEECIIRIARTNNIRWYLLHPGEKIFWSDEAQRQYVFESDGYRVFDMCRWGL